MGVTNFDVVVASALIGGGVVGPFPQKSAFTKFVDGTYGSDGNSGDSPDQPYATVQKGITAAKAGGVVYVFPQDMVSSGGDPVSYAENIVIPATHDRISVIGVSHGRTQCGLPQIKGDATTTTEPIITVNAQGVLLANLGINGITGTGGGVLLNSDGATGTKNATGAAILNCHFKNCIGTTATEAITGGAIMWSAYGDCWQVLIKGNRFYKNVGDVVLKGTSNSVPQDVVIEDNIFSGPAASVNCNLFLKGGGSGMNGVIINNNTFGQLPAVGGAADRYMDLTGCVGMCTRNMFGCQTSGTGGTPITFKASGTGALVPTTVHMAGNFGQSITIDATGGEISIA